MNTSIHIYFDYISAPVNSPRWADFDLEDDDDTSTDNGPDQMECFAYSEIADSPLTSPIEDDLDVLLSPDIASEYSSDSDTVAESLSSDFVEVNGIGCLYTCLEYNCAASFLTEEDLEWHYVEDHMPSFPYTTPHANSELELPLILGDSTISADGLTCKHRFNESKFGGIA
ncbi:unnamed protein product [Somion occarium]|uniref:C2H2-type domain-containing protein n=1 Tax=Somion occarium TaxID=3059160 RepID=A0ABP1DL89_9APHY